MIHCNSILYNVKKNTVEAQGKTFHFDILYTLYP